MLEVTKQTFDLILESPVRAFAFLLLILVVVLLDVIRRSFFKRLKENEAKLAKYEADAESFFTAARVTLEKKADETVLAMRLHSEDLGKATKAVNGDMLKIQEATFTLKQEFITRTVELEAYARQLESKTAALQHVLELNIEKFEQKLVHVVNLRKELSTITGKVEKVEETQGQFRIMVGKQAEQIGTIAKVIKRHEEHLKKDPTK